MPAGAPEKYTDDIPQKIYEYVESCQDKKGKIVVQESKEYKMYKEKLIVSIPSIEGLAVHLKITKKTLYNWEKDKDKTELIHALDYLRGQQAQRLIEKGLSGDYNPTIAKLLLHSHGYKDRHDTTTDDEPIKLDPTIQVIDTGHKLANSEDEIDG